MKHLLPLIFFSFAIVAQDSPKIDPNTGLPTAGVAKKENFDIRILAALHDVSTENILVVVSDVYGDLPDETKQMLNNQKELFSRRNKFTYTENDRDTYLIVNIRVGTTLTNKIITGYQYSLEIGRWVYLGKDKKNAPVILTRRIDDGTTGRLALKGQIDNALDKLALHIFEATKDQD